jgi:hypothetical protein
MEQINVYNCKPNSKNILECGNSKGWNTTSEIKNSLTCDYNILYGCIESKYPTLYDMRIVFPTNVKNAKFYMIKNGGKHLTIEIPSVQIDESGIYDFLLFDEKHQLSFSEFPESIYIIKILIPTYNKITLHDICDDSIKLLAKH